jgi:hypothetical protein
MTLAGQPTGSTAPYSGWSLVPVVCAVVPELPPVPLPSLVPVVPVVPVVVVPAVVVGVVVEVVRVRADHLHRVAVVVPVAVAVAVPVGAVLVVGRAGRGRGRGVGCGVLGRRVLHDHRLEPVGQVRRCAGQAAGHVGADRECQQQHHQALPEPRHDASLPVDRGTRVRRP